MSMMLYDMAVTEKIKEWVSDSPTLVLSPDSTMRLFKIHADNTGDEPIRFPLIAVARDRDAELPLTGKRALTYRGPTFESDGVSVDHLNGIRVILSYTLHIYTKFYEEADAYERELLFALINTPKMVLHIPYNGCDRPITSYIQVSSTLTDNSDVPDTLVSGQLYHKIIKFKLVDAYFLSYNHAYVPRIVGTGVKLTSHSVLKEDQFEIKDDGVAEYIIQFEKQEKENHEE